MTYEMMMETLEGLGADVSYYEMQDPVGFDVTIEDTDGFDEDWCEMDREFDDPEAVEAFEEMLERECLSREGDFYITFHFDGFDVRLGYAGYDS